MQQYTVAIIGMGRFGEILYRQLEKLNIPQLKLAAVTSRPDDYPDMNVIEFEEAKLADVIIPAVPISTFEETIIKLAEGINPDAVVVDVCSVKVRPIEWMKQRLPESVGICGTHPLFGPDSIKINGGSLNGLPIIVCPVRLKPMYQSLIMRLVEVTGMDGFVMTAEQHDEKMAWSLLYFQLVGRVGDQAGVKDTGINTVGFSKLLDLQQNYALNDSWQLFQDMYKYNPYGPEMLQKVKQSLTEIETKLNS